MTRTRTDLYSITNERPDTTAGLNDKAVYQPKRLLSIVSILKYSVYSASSQKRPSSAPLISRHIMRLGQAAVKQQRPRCPNRKMYLETKEADEGTLCMYFGNSVFSIVTSRYFSKIPKCSKLDHCA